MKLAAFLLPAVLAALLAGPLSAHPHPGPTGVVIEADAVHFGDGRVARPGRILVEGGIVLDVGASRDVKLPPGWRVRHVVSVVPGLVAGQVVTGRTGSDRSVDATRLAVDLVDPADDPSSWLARGVTAVAISPGTNRLVTGRGGVIRLAERPEQRIAVLRGPLHAVLSPEAHEPPLLFEPHEGVNVDQPLEPAAPQRPHGPLGAVAELRGLLTARRSGVPDAFAAVARREVPLRVRADREEDLRRALVLAAELDIDLVLEGATEAWKLADEIAAAQAIVVLDVPQPGVATVPDPGRGEANPAAAALLDRAGVPVALSAERWTRRADPLLLAAAAVRTGLPEGRALAAVTSIAARAAGAVQLGLLRRGAPADLVALDGPPLGIASRPLFVLVGGVERFTAAGRADEPASSGGPMAVSAGTIHADGRVFRNGLLVMRDGLVASVGDGLAVPGGTRLLDFGPDSVLVPGFVDAFSQAGLESGPASPGGPRLRAADQIEVDDESLEFALESGVTSALVAPAGRGSIEGIAALVSTALRSREEDRAPAPPAVLFPEEGREAPGAALPRLDVIAAEAGVVFALDEGPADDGPRGPRLTALQGLLGKAKGHHERWTQWEKRDEKGNAKGPAKKSRQGPRKDDKPAMKEPPKDLALDALRPLFRGAGKAFLRVGRHDAILRGLDAFKESGLTPVLIGAEEADLVADELARRKVTVVLGPGVVRREAGREVNVAAVLMRAGVSVALGSFAPGGSAQLPLAAAAAVRDGLSPPEALAALTVRAAEAAGAPAGLGRLAQGDRADLVVFSGAPFEPTSRVLAVIVRGRLVAGLALQEEAAP